MGALPRPYAKLLLPALMPLVVIGLEEFADRAQFEARALEVGALEPSLERTVHTCGGNLAAASR